MCPLTPLSSDITGSEGVDVIPARPQQCNARVLELATSDSELVREGASNGSKQISASLNDGLTIGSGPNKRAKERDLIILPVRHRACHNTSFPGLGVN
jgi:hypothetical protein